MRAGVSRLTRNALAGAAVSAMLWSATVEIAAQGRGGRGGGPPAPPGRAGAPVDLTGTWVSVVTEDWQWRMRTPAKGDTTSVPLNAEGRRVADSWDPSMDGRCEAYGVGGIMRMPTRLKISWQDDLTLKIETDAGKQTRVFHFGNPPETQTEDWQGASKAEWDLGNAGSGGLFFGAERGGARSGSLKVVTTKMRPGYATRNGVPYSNNATLTEYYDLVKEKSGAQYLVLTAMLADPTYMNQPMWTAVHFRKQADASGWNPVACGGK